MSQGQSSSGTCRASELKLEQIQLPGSISWLAGELAPLSEARLWVRLALSPWHGLLVPPMNSCAQSAFCLPALHCLCILCPVSHQLVSSGPPACCRLTSPGPLLGVCHQVPAAEPRPSPDGSPVICTGFC